LSAGEYGPAAAGLDSGVITTASIGFLLGSVGRV